jgi:hypothetical protein
MVTTCRSLVSANRRQKRTKLEKRLRARKQLPGSKLRKTAVQRKGRANQSAKPSGKQGVSVSEDEIRLRAYFIAERRMREGLPGDSGHDWLEARRQLAAEAEIRA